MSRDPNRIDPVGGGLDAQIVRQPTYVALTALAPAFLSVPIITGTLAQGSTLSVTTGGWVNSPTSYAYQWRRGGNAILGATTSTYALVAADVGYRIDCIVTATNSAGSGIERAYATPPVPGVGVTPTPVPANTAAPAITGTAQEGQILTVSNGAWTNSPTAYTYQWNRAGTPIAGSVNAARTLTSADVGSALTCTVTAANAGGAASATSAATAAVIAATVAVPANTVAPVVTGSTAVGSVLTTDNGTWSGAPTSYAYQWRRDGVDISGATAATYTSVTADGGKAVTCRVLATNAGGSASAVSNAISVIGTPTIAFANPTQTVAEGNTGTTTVTNTINVTRNGVTGALVVNLTYAGTATSGADYATPPTTVTIASGANSASFDLTINGDTVVETDETIIINAVLAAYSSATASKTITVTNDDVASGDNLTGMRHFATGVTPPGSHYYNNDYKSNGSDTTHNAWSMHVNRAGKAVTSLSLIYSGWGNALPAEADMPNAYTVYAAVEYPIGSTPQQVPVVGGGSALNVVPGSNTSFDILTLATPIPDGAPFRVRAFFTCAAGQYFPTSFNFQGEGGTVNGVSMANFAESGVGLANKTLSGSVTSNNVLGLCPSAIITNGIATKAVLYAAGDSHELAVQAGPPQQGDDNNVGITGWAAAGLCPFIQDAGGGGQVMEQVVAGKMARRLDLLTKAGVTHAFANWSVNDYTRSDVAADPTKLPAAILNYATQVNNIGVKVIWYTTRAVVDSTKGYYRSADMTSRSTQGFVGASSLRGYVHSSTIRAKAAPLFDYVELGSLETGAVGSDSGILIDSTSGSARWPLTATATTAVSATTTVIPSNAPGATNYYAGGAIIFTSGSLAGTYATVASSTSGGQITLTAALASAPAAGDTFRAFPASARPTGDGSHPFSVYARIEADIARAKIKALLGQPTIAYTTANLRLTQLNNMTETVDPAGGYQYATSSTSGDWNGKGRSAADTLPANQDGEFRFVIPAGFDPVKGAGPVMGMEASPGVTAVNYNSMKASVYTEGSLYKLNTTSTNRLDQAGGADLAPAPGDVVRLRRQGKVIYVEVSKDGGLGWALIRPYAADSGFLVSMVAALLQGFGSGQPRPQATLRSGVPANWAGVNLVIHGNSFINGDTTTGGTAVSGVAAYNNSGAKTLSSTSLPGQLLQLEPFASAQAAGTLTVTVIGEPGRSWEGFATTSVVNPDTYWVDGKINVLLVGENTNQIFNNDKNAVDTETFLKAYMTARRAAHPGWKILNFGTIPRQKGTSDADDSTRNATMRQVDADVAANPAAFGVDRFIDLRNALSPFNFTGDLNTKFVDRANLYGESANPRVHPGNNGAMVLAGIIAAACMGIQP